MGFANDTGYVPLTVNQLMEVVRVNVNAQFGTTYTLENFIGTNFYKFFYALIQRLQENEVKTAEIFTRMQHYFNITNEKVLRPNTTHPGIIDYFASRGWLVSTKAPIAEDAGKLYICVDVDHEAPGYPAQKIEIANLVKDCAVAGVVTQGTEVETIVLDNNQSFDFKFFLPNYVDVELRLTVTVSDNNLFAVESPGVVKEKLLANIAAEYRLGKNFEPQRYFTIADAPWAAKVVLEYSLNEGSTWLTAVYDAAFDAVLDIDPEKVTVIED